MTVSDNASMIPAHSETAVAVIVIGRNEGKRLRLCLESVRLVTPTVVYVDSGSTDDSVNTASALGAAVVQLDMSKPFTAARARNEGFAYVESLALPIKYVFFVDGDCEVESNWLPTARTFLDRHSDVAVVWGQRRERHPEKSIYNRLCDIEWSTYPIGETRFCGGDALIRIDPFRSVNGYRSDLICGEEPELCIRLRTIGWKIWHLDEKMTLHDASIHRFGQWWRRMLRSGYGYALGVSIHGNTPEKHWVVEWRRAWIWGLFLPLGVLVFSFFFTLWSLAALIIYPAQVIRLAFVSKRFTSSNWEWALAMVIGKFAEMFGQVKFIADRLRGVKSALIEYK